jgi:Ribonuclease G/E
LELLYDIIYESCPWHTRASLLDEDGNLLGIHYDDKSFTYILGTITLGIVRKIVPALNAAFVDIGDTIDGFLPLDTLDDGYKIFEGEKIVTRIAREKTAEKGAILNAQVLYDKSSAKNLKAPVILQAGPSALSRALMDAGLTPANVWINDDRFHDEITNLIPEEKIFHIAEHPHTDILDVLDEQIEGLHTPTFNIAGGARLTIEMTKAVTAIDVDSSMATTGKTDHKNIPLMVNKLAAKEIARLCHLLDIGGSIIIDFITLATRQDRKELQKYLEECFSNRSDKKTDVLKISRYGIVEMNREKSGENLLEKLSLPIYTAGEFLLHLWRNPNHKHPITIETTEEVADILKQRLTTQASMAYLGIAVTVRS